jgi:hypothetical protein
MKKAIICNFLFSFTFTCISYGQIKVSGIVNDAKTGRPLSYAHIYQRSNKSIGTTTNGEGMFSIILPEASINDSLVASFIGYQTKVFPTKKSQSAKSSIIINLQESPSELKEIFVFAQDTLNKFLQKAFDRIRDNYPLEDFLIKGHYRETNILEPTDSFIYFSEAKIEFFSPSYNNTISKYGSARIIEGGKLEIKNRYAYSNVHFYAGIYSPQRFDFVREKFEFINPKQFNKYHYTIDRTFEFEGRPTIVIDFKPKENALFEGKLFIDKVTLAYVKSDFKLSASGVKRENAFKINSFNYKSRSYTVQYKVGKDDKWHIWFAIQDGKGSNSKYKNDLRYTNEFVAVEEIRVDKNPISDAESIPYHSFYTSQEKTFSDRYWIKPETIARTKKSDSNIRLLFLDTLTRKNLLPEDTSNRKAKSKKSFRNNFLKVVSKISTGISIAYVPLDKRIGNFDLSYVNFVSISKNIDDISNTALGVDIKYYLNDRLCISLQGYGNTTSNSSVSIVSLGLQASRRLVGWKRPLYFEAGLHAFYSDNEVKLGSTSAISGFNQSGVNFRASEKVFVDVGQTSLGTVISSEFIYKFHARISLFAKLSALINIEKKDNLFLRKSEPSLFSSGEALTLDLRSSDILFSIDNNLQVKSPISFQGVQLLFNSGIRIGLFR